MVATEAHQAAEVGSLDATILERGRTGSAGATREQRPIAVFLTLLGAGAIVRVNLAIARGLAARGHRVQLVVCRREGAMAVQIPGEIEVVELTASNTWKTRWAVLKAGHAAALAPSLILPWKIPKTLHFVPSLAEYLKRERPHALLASTRHRNVSALLAREIAGVSTRIVLSEHTLLSTELALGTKTGDRRILPALRQLYPGGDAIVASSLGVKDDLSTLLGVDREKISTIYYPLVGPGLAIGQAFTAKAAEPPEHPWFGDGGPPVIIGCGRLVHQKDFPTLIRAFALMRPRFEARLLILGKGPSARKDEQERHRLATLAADLGVGDAVDLPGFAENPLAYMSQAALFVLSSLYEGFGMVLVEALACGCPVVSTDCLSGPAEILEDGTYGPLVPVGDPDALAEAMVQTLRSPPDKERLRQRAAEFALERAAERYEAELLG